MDREHIADGRVPSEVRDISQAVSWTYRPHPNTANGLESTGRQMQNLGRAKTPEYLRNWVVYQRLF